MKTPKLYSYSLYSINCNEDLRQIWCGRKWNFTHYL